MNKLQSHVLSRFSLVDQDIGVNQLIDIFKRNSLDFEFGYQVLDVKVISEISLGVEILKRSPTYLLNFDTENREMVRTESFLFTKSFFEVNLGRSYLLTYGSLSQNSDVKIFLKRAGLTYNLDQLYIDIANFYESSRYNYEHILLKGIAIKKFNYRNGMIGRFAGEIVDKSIVAELLANYSKDILKATFEIKGDGYKFDLQIFPNGAFKILTNAGEHQDILENIIPNLLR